MTKIYQNLIILKITLRFKGRFFPQCSNKWNHAIRKVVLVFNYTVRSRYNINDI